jgi:hypothetical protein
LRIYIPSSSDEKSKWIAKNRNNSGRPMTARAMSRFLFVVALVIKKNAAIAEPVPFMRIMA